MHLTPSTCHKLRPVKCDVLYVWPYIQERVRGDSDICKC